MTSVSILANCKGHRQSSELIQTWSKLHVAKWCKAHCRKRCMHEEVTILVLVLLLIAWKSDARYFKPIMLQSNANQLLFHTWSNENWSKKKVKTGSFINKFVIRKVSTVAW